MAHRWLLDLRFQLTLIAAIPAAWAMSLPAPPITDFAEHALAIAGIRDALFESTTARVQLEANFASSPYLAYHVVGALLAKLVGSAMLANRLLVFGIALAFPLSMRRLLAAFDAPPEYAWFAILPFYCRALTIGFLPFMASIPLGMLLLAEAKRDNTDAPLRRSVGMALLSALLFYCHISSFSIFVPAAFFVVSFDPMQRVERFSLATLARRYTWGFVPVLLGLRFVLHGRLAMRGEGLDDAPSAPMSLARRFYAFPAWIYDNFRERHDDAVAVLYWLAFLWALIATVRHIKSNRASAIAWVHGIPCAVALLVFLATPFQVGAAAFLNVRLAPIVLLLCLPLFRAPLGTRMQVAVASTALVGGLVFGTLARAVYHEQGAPLLKVTESIPPGARTVSLNFVHGARSAFLDPYPYSGSLAAAERGGLSGFSFAELPHWSVHYRRDAAPPKDHPPFWVFAPCTFRNQTDGVFFDHVIVRGAVDPFRNHPIGPVYERVIERAMYTLYRKVPGRFWTVDNGGAQDDGPCARPEE
jgi:hypothetical protein